jgi:hypothetical protein
MERGNALVAVKSVEVKSAGTGAFEQLEQLVGLAITPAVGRLRRARGSVNVPRQKFEKAGLEGLP